MKGGRPEAAFGAPVDDRGVFSCRELIDDGIGLGAALDRDCAFGVADVVDDDFVLIARAGVFEDDR